MYIKHFLQNYKRELVITVHISKILIYSSSSLNVNYYKLSNNGIQLLLLFKFETFQYYAFTTTVSCLLI